MALRYIASLILIANVVACEKKASPTPKDLEKPRGKSYAVTGDGKVKLSVISVALEKNKDGSEAICTDFWLPQSAKARLAEETKALTAAYPNARTNQQCLFRTNIVGMCTLVLDTTSGLEAVDHYLSPAYDRAKAEAKCRADRGWFTYR